MNEREKKRVLAAAACVERGWVQDTYAVNSEGLTVNPNDPAAEKWCLLGAMRREGVSLMMLIPALDDRGINHRFYGSFALQSWNDKPERRKEEVVDLLLKAAYAQDVLDEAFAPEPEKALGAV